MGMSDYELAVINAIYLFALITVSMELKWKIVWYDTIGRAFYACISETTITKNWLKTTRNRVNFLLFIKNCVNNFNIYHKWIANLSEIEWNWAFQVNNQIMQIFFVENIKYMVHTTNYYTIHLCCSFFWQEFQ